MPHFVYVAGRTVRMIEAPAMPQIMPYEFPTKDAAELYRRQVEAHYGFGPTEPLPSARKARYRVKDCQSGTIYETAAELAKELGVSRSAISQHLNEPFRYRTIKGRWFVRLDENGKEILP